MCVCADRVHLGKDFKCSSEFQGLQAYFLHHLLHGRCFHGTSNGLQCGVVDSVQLVLVAFEAVAQEVVAYSIMGRTAPV